MSSRSNMPGSACSCAEARSWRACAERVDGHIFLKFLQTGARRGNGRQCLPQHYFIRARELPGIYLAASEASLSKRTWPDGYCGTHTEPTSPAEPRGGGVGELGARADTATRRPLVRGNRSRIAGADCTAAA